MKNTVGIHIEPATSHFVPFLGIPPPHSCLRVEPSNRPIDHMDKLQEQPDVSFALM